MEFGLLALWLVISLLSLVFTPLKKLLRTMFGPQPPTCGLHTLFSAPSNLIQMTRSWSTLDLRLFTLVEVRAFQYLHSHSSAPAASKYAYRLAISSWTTHVHRKPRRKVTQSPRAISTAGPPPSGHRDARPAVTRPERVGRLGVSR